MHTALQSPAEGVVRLPSPLVSPPTVSSLSDVKITGSAVEPWATSAPPSCTRMFTMLANFTIAPG
jgi:hypothetical protein